MAEIRPTEYVSGRAPAAHEHLARTARAKARTSAAGYAAVGIKARVPPVLWPGRFVELPVRAVVLLRASVVSFGKDGTTCRTMYLPSLHFGRGTLLCFLRQKGLARHKCHAKNRVTHMPFFSSFSSIAKSCGKYGHKCHAPPGGSHLPFCPPLASGQLRRDQAGGTSIGTRITRQKDRTSYDFSLEHAHHKKDTNTSHD